MNCLKMKKELLISPFLTLLFFNFSVYYHAKLQTITETHIQTRKLRAISVFLSYPPFSTAFSVKLIPFSQKPPIPYTFLQVRFILSRKPRLLPDSTIFSPIAILSAASKNTKKRGPPTTVMNPTKPKIP